MSEELELCSKCNKGYFRPTGDASILGEKEHPFRQTGTTREMRCDNCGQKRADVGINEYV
jgi:DNA-directed RNA polymerase subunit RPC12/RpoP